MQFAENHDSIKMQIHHLEPEGEDEDVNKWNIVPILKTEAEVSECLEVRVKICLCY